MAKYLKTYFSKELLTTEKLEGLFKEKLGDKYTYSVKNASSNAVVKTVSGKRLNTLTVVKNAYHRTVITLSPTSDGRVQILFGEDSLAWWLDILNSNLTFIGSFIIGLIYGNGDGFYDEIQDFVQNNLEVEVQEIDVSLGSLFKKRQE